MEHFYKGIQGWFDYAGLYNSILDELPDGFSFVEVGVWKGRSLSYFAVECVNRGKSGRIFAVDHWLGSEEHRPGASSTSLSSSAGTDSSNTSSPT